MGIIIENGNYCVYIHTSPNGKMYVGQTRQKPEYRWNNGNGYLSKNKHGKYSQPALAHAIIKYGWDNFEHEIVASNLTKEEADNFEKLLIKKLNTMDSRYGYNLREGGQNSEISEETRKKISETLKGNILSEETRKKMSESRKGKYTGSNSPCAKKVVQYDLQGNLIKIWNSIVEAERELGLTEYSISRCCNDVHTTTGGFIWRYYGEELTQEYISQCNRPHNEKRVVQYSLSGELIRIFDSIIQAERELGISHSHISSCCNDEKKTIGGFIWRYYGEELTQEHIEWCNTIIGRKKCIAQYSLSGEFIRAFESMVEAELQTGINRNNISACCREERNKAGGFIWKYYDENEVEIVA